MAKQEKAAKPEKKQGTFRRLGSLYKMTMKADKQAIWIALGFVAMSIGVGFIAANLLSFGNAFSYWAWIVTGFLGGVMLFLITMSRRAEKVMYSNIEGQQGAVGAVLTSALKRNWRVSERPVAIAPKTFDAVYRAVGPAGVLLVAEGSRARVRPMIEDEKRKIQRVASGVPIDVLYLLSLIHI
jgi:hypothetical protein